MVTESDSVRGAEVSREVYEALEPARRGTVDYYKKVADGSIRVEPEIYEATDAGSRGEIRYFRRERPRLAEMEVRTIGENIALGLAARQGVAQKIGIDTTVVTSLVDGLYETTVGTTVRTPALRFFFLDLGAFFWVDRVQMFFLNAGYWGPITQYEIQTSDGSLTPEGTLAWTSQALGGDGGMDYHANVFEPTVARYISIPYSGGLAGRQRRHAGDPNLRRGIPASRLTHVAPDRAGRCPDAEIDRVGGRHAPGNLHRAAQPDRQPTRRRPPLFQEGTVAR